MRTNNPYRRYNRAKAQATAIVVRVLIVLAILAVIAAAVFAIGFFMRPQAEGKDTIMRNPADRFSENAMYREHGEKVFADEVPDPEEIPSEYWHDKKVAWYGDSLTEYYKHCIKVDEYFGWEAYNCGISGTTVSNFDGSSMCNEERLYDEDVCIPGDVEVILVMAGSNDWARNVPMGDKTIAFDEEGRLIADVSTFYGACNQMFYNLTRVYPDAQIIVLGTPFGKLENFANFSDAFGLYNNLGLSSIDYGDALCEMAGRWGIESFNIGRLMGVNVNNIHELMPDGLHFTDGEVSDKVAEVIIRKLMEWEY